jgi:4-amino-4-deoxy-L-arabinose transferase-like glycosyltransferase
MTFTSPDKLKLLFSDTRFWIFLFFIIRLVGITNAPLEIAHNWRQAFTNMVARNFLQRDANIFYPQIDMGGDRTGIVGSEFPLFNYLIYLVSLVFDYSHWYGRMINLVVSSFGIYFFYLLVEKISTKKVALYSSIVLLSSIWFSYSRKSMPDVFSVSLVIIGLYYCYRYLTEGGLGKLLLFFLFATAGMLCKIPALSLVSAVAIILIVKEISTQKKITVLLTTALSLAIVFAWYYLWVPYLLETFRYYLYFPRGLMEGMKEISENLPGFFEKFYYDSLHSYIALTFFAVGTYAFITKSSFYLKAAIFIISISFFIFILKTGFVFPLHSYYIIPFTPVMALMVGFGIEKIPVKYHFIPLLLISAEGIANQQHDFFIKDSELYKLSLEAIVNKSTEVKELVVINGGESPQELYFANRKGWTVDNSRINQKSLDELKNLGAAYLIIDKRSFKDSIAYYPVIFSNQDFAIYKLY